MNILPNSRASYILFPLMACIAASLVSQVRSHWWSMATNPIMNTLILGTTPMCGELDTLSVNQKALCVRYSNHMQYVSAGASAGINECKFQFRGHRWNCSTVADASVFGKVINTASTETAFAYAISAAGVVVAVARACRNEQLEQCGCSSAGRPDGLNRDWRWGGCGDNTEYAYGFAREFIDAKERDNTAARSSKVRARRAMNMHNNEAGRLIAVRSARPSCKCHGVSGSCSIKTCWMKIPEFRDIGNELKNQYAHAILVRSNRRGMLRPRRTSAGPLIPSSSLVYLDSSPDYCDYNKRLGVLGTRGRECKKDAPGSDGCGLMCCARGFRTHRVRVMEKCNCKFQWCCSVKCQMCERVIRRHVCK